MVRVPLVGSFRYIHEPLPIGDPVLPMLGNAALVDALRDRILHSEGGAFLVTGFRGVGKSTVILRALEQLSVSAHPDDFVVPVIVNVARATDVDRLLFAVTRRIFESLSDQGLFERLPAESQHSLLLAYMRTSLAFKETQSDAIERAGAISAGMGGALKPPLVGLSVSAKRTRSLATEAQFLAYSETDVEHDIMRIVSLLHQADSLRVLPRGRARWLPWHRSARGRIRLVVVLDEADKLTATDSGIAMVEQILGGLKNVLTMQGAHYLLVAGSDLHDHATKDVARGNSIYESIFGWRLYVPCSWNAVDNLLGTVIPDGGGEHLTAFRDYLQFKARGIPRRLLQEFNAFVVWGNDAPWLEISEGELERVAFYARLESIVSEFLEIENRNRSSMFPIDIDLDRHRLGIYYVMDWVLRSEGEPFSAMDLASGQGRVALDPIVQPPQDIVARFLEHLEVQRIIEVIRQANAPEGPIELPLAVRGPIYRLSTSIRKDLFELATGNESERAALNLSARQVSAAPDSTFTGMPVVRVLADRYELRSAIGMGGMGTVYEGYDRILDRRVAVKAIREFDSRQEELRRRLEREARIAVQLKHPQIVQTYDVVNDPEVGPAIVMELLEGTDLSQEVYRNGSLSEEEIVIIGTRITDALSYLEERGIVRIDLKPSNIRLEPTRGPVILDLGIARQVGLDRLTDSNEVVGTISYAAPEMFRGADLTHLVDIYALGIVLYFCASGTSPHEGQDPMAIIHSTLYEDADLSALPVSRSLKAIISKALSKRPEDRYQSAGDMRADLERTPAAEIMRLQTARLKRAASAENS